MSLHKVGFFFNLSMYGRWIFTKKRWQLLICTRHLFEIIVVLVCVLDNLLPISPSPVPRAKVWGLKSCPDLLIFLTAATNLIAVPVSPLSCLLIPSCHRSKLVPTIIFLLVDSLTFIKMSLWPAILRHFLMWLCSTHTTFQVTWLGVAKIVKSQIKEDLKNWRNYVRHT